VEPAEPESAPAPPRKRTRVGFGAGFGYFSSSDSRTGESQVKAPGIALELHSGFPVADNWKVNLRFNWGLTEFHRTESMIETANVIGDWTLGAYGTVWEWAVQKDEYWLFRFFGALFASVGLAMPLAVAGGLYVLSPFAPTTYLGCDITTSYHLGNDDLNGYVEAGVGLVSYVHPRYGGLYGGIGPTVGFGVKLGFVTIGAHGTWSPPGAHGEPTGSGSNVYVGGLTATFGN
jgi:hypothetical protein